MNYLICMPEVRKQCEAGKIMDCEGVFPARHGACMTRNRAAKRERQRKEAAAYGIKDADHPRKV